MKFCQQLAWGPLQYVEFWWARNVKSGILSHNSTHANLQSWMISMIFPNHNHPRLLVSRENHNRGWNQICKKYIFQVEEDFTFVYNCKQMMIIVAKINKNSTFYKTQKWYWKQNREPFIWDFHYLTVEATVWAHHLRLSFMSISLPKAGILQFINGSSFLFFSRTSHASDK